MHSQAVLVILDISTSHCEQKEVYSLAKTEGAEQPPSQVPACSGIVWGAS